MGVGYFVKEVGNRTLGRRGEASCYSHFKTFVAENDFATHFAEPSSKTLNKLFPVLFSVEKFRCGLTHVELARVQ